MPAKHLTTALLAATAFTALTSPAAHAAPTRLDTRPACTFRTTKPCYPPCAPHVLRYCAQPRPGVATRDDMTTRYRRPTPRPALLPPVLPATPQNSCHTAVGAAAPC